MRAEGAAWLLQHGGAPDRALFMCWPRFADDDAHAAPADAVLAAYRGDVLALVGERGDGATWWPSDEALTAGGWREAEAVWIPNWPGMRDELVIFKRSGPRIA